jgi:hypothetical protein
MTPEIRMNRLATPFAGMMFALMLPLAGLQAPGSIEGIVVATGSSIPVPRAAVTLETAGGGEVAKLTASIDGKFAVPGIPPGEYLIRASQDGFAHSSHGLRVTVTSGRKSEVSLGIVPDGAISGRVVDWDGLPVPGILVQALTFIQGPRSWRTLTVRNTTQTNDLGEYRLYWLPPGSYFVSTSTAVDNDSPRAYLPDTRWGQRLAGLQLVPTYFPNAVNALAATRIDVKAGETFTGAVIRLVDQRALSISGVVSIASARGSTSVDLTPRNPDSGLQSLTTSADDSGAFMFANVVPGSYVVTAEATNTEGKEVFGSMPIDVGTRNIENLSVVLTTGFDLKIRVTIEGRSRRLEDPQMEVDLQPLIWETPSPTVERSGDDELTMHHFMPGDYSFGDYSFRTSWNATGPLADGGLYLKSARFGGSDILSGGLHIDGPTSIPLDIVVAEGAGTLSGSVLNDRKQPVSNAIVVLIPDPPLRGRSDLYQNTITDASGKFKMSGITPGQYKAFSWEVTTEKEWQYADFMELYEDRGQSIRIEGERRDPIALQLIPPRY